MAWKNCEACARLYKVGTGCANTACKLYKRDGPASPVGSSSASSGSTPPVLARQPSPPRLSEASSSSSQAVPAAHAQPTRLVGAPEPISLLRVTPPAPLVTPSVASASSISSHALPVIESPRGDPVARSGGSIDIRQQLLDLDGGSISALMASGAIARLGKGVNKQVYRVNGAPWVVAVTTAGEQGSKWRAVSSEIEQLIALRAAGVTVPSLGPVTTADAALIPVLSEDGQPAKAFIEQLIVGRHDLCRQESHGYADAFANEIERVIGGRRNFSLDRFNAAKGDLTALARYFEQGTDIPDFQIVVEEATGHVYTIDPGDPAATGSVLDKHRGWVATWMKVIAAFEPRKR